MKISISKLYINLLLLWPVFGLIINLTSFSSFFNLLFQQILFFLCLFLTVKNHNFWRRFFHILFLPFLYVFFFLIITYFGVDLSYSMKNRYYLISLDLINFFLFYTAGNLYNIRIVSDLFVKSISLYVVFSLCLGYFLVQVNGIDQIRVISGLEIPFALCFALFSKAGFLYIFILLIGALSSIKKTLIITSIIPFVIVVLFKSKNKYFNQFYPTKISSKKSLFILIPILLFLSPLIFQFIQATFLRIATDGDDIYRLMQFSEFIRLSKIHFPFGTGISTFGSLTKDTIPYNTFTSDGNILDGMSLHNTPMHVFLEGGVIIFILYLLLYFKNISRAYSLFKNVKTSNIGSLFFNLLLVSFVFGLLNQLHGQLFYFGLFGLISGTFYNKNLFNN